MSKTNQQQKEKTLQIKIPDGGYPRRLFFNRLQVQHDEEFCLIHFGLVSRDGILLDAYSCAISALTLAQNRDSLLSYKEHLHGFDPSGVRLWQGGKNGLATDVADIITMSVNSNTAETCLSLFSMTAASRYRSGPDAQPTAQAIALLRSSVEMQRQLIEELYANA